MADTGTLRWTPRPIFLASTFRDLDAERDHLRDHAFLELGERLRERAHYLETVDLRQGVEVGSIADEEARELQVLSVCLDEITRSRPFFVGLLGDRYGWVPPAARTVAAARAARMTGDMTGRSVTELEILHGVLESTDQQRRSWFYLREMDYTGMPPELRRRYDDRFVADDATASAEERDAARARIEKLAALKARIKTTLPGRWRSYALRWDVPVGGLKALDAMVVADLWSDLDPATRDWQRSAPATWQESDRRDLDDFVADRTRTFIDRPAVTARLLDHSLGSGAEDASWGLAVVGESGAGKSSVFGHVYRALHERDDVLLLGGAAGISVASGNVDRLLRRWIGELAAFLAVADPFEGEEAQAVAPDRVDEAFRALLFLAAERTRVVVLVDALNQLENTVRAQYLTWLPTAWPANARCVATAVPSTPASTLAERAGVAEYRLPPVEREEATGIARRFFRDRYHRAVNERALTALLDKARPDDGTPAHTNPLWLTLALQEMNLLEADDYERADRDFAHLPGAERIEALQVREAEELPANAQGVYARVLDRAERGFGREWTQALMNAIALGRVGWRESDLRALVPALSSLAWQDLAFAGVRRIFGPHLVRRGTDAQWDVFHAQLREAVLTRNLPGAEVRRALHGQIADHLQTLDPDDPVRATETVFHLEQLGDAARGAVYLAGLMAMTARERSGVAATLAELIEAQGGREENSDTGQWVADCLRACLPVPPALEVVANFLAFDLDSRLIVTGTSEPARGRLLEALREAVAAVAETPGDNIQSLHSASLNKLGDFYLRRGVESDSALALASFEEALRIAQRLAAENPRDAEATRDVSVSLERLGDFYLRRGAEGDAARALAAFEEALRIARRLATQSPSDTQAARDVSVSLNKFGNFYLRRGGDGDAARALGSFVEALRIRQRLAAQNPSDAQAARDVFVSLNQLGDFYLRRGGDGDAARALTNFEEALRIAHRLAAQNPSAAQAGRDLGGSLLRFGDFYLRRGDDGDAARALTSFEEALRIAKRLVAQDPGGAQAFRYVSISLERLGGFYLRRGAEGDAGRALAAFEEALRIARRLATQNPSDALAARELSITLRLFGDFYLRRGGEGDAARALTNFEEAFRIAQRLAAQNPSDAQAARDVSVSLECLGDFCLQRGGEGDAARALSSFEEVLRIRQRLAAQNPSDALAARDVFVSLNKFGDFCLRRGGEGDAARALTNFEEAFRIAQRLAAQNPSDAQAARDVSVSLECLGDFCLRRGGEGDAARALTSFEEALRTRQRLAAQNPGDAEAARDVSISLNRLGDFYLRRGGEGDAARALTSFEEALHTRQRLAAQNPDDALAARDVFVSLNKFGDFCLRRGGEGDAARALTNFEEAFRIAQRLAAQNPSDAQAARDVSVSLNKLGDFYLRRGREGDAVRALSSFEEVLRTAQRLAAQNPGDAQAARDVSVSLERLGDFYLGRGGEGDAARALASFEEGHRTLQRLAAQNPSDAQTARYLSVSLKRLGGLYLRRASEGDAERALTLLEESLRIARQLAAQDPGSAQASRDVLAPLFDLWQLASQAGDGATAGQHLADCRRELRRMRQAGLELDQPLADLLQDLDAMTLPGA